MIKLKRIKFIPLVVIIVLFFGIIAASSRTNAVAPNGNYFDHALIIIMEDHGIQDVCGRSPPPCLSSNGASYMAGLANTYAVGSQYLGITHVSQTDYMALIGGDTFGCSSSPCSPVPNSNLVDRLEASGLTWKGYMENQNVASGCDTGYQLPYTQEHNPFVAFQDVLNSSARCNNIVLPNPSSCNITDCVLINDLNSASAPNFMFLTPNDCNNMHGYTYPNGTVLCPESISMGDNYISSLVPNILNSAAFTNQRSALFIIFDEGNGYCPLDGSSKDCVYAVLAGNLAKASFATSNLYDHYSLLTTIENNWNLQSLSSNDANALIS